MSASDMHFEPDPYSSKNSPNAPPTPVFTRPEDDFTRPEDDFTMLPVAPHTIFLLAVIRPYNDTYTTHGPVTKFLHLESAINMVIQSSPNAIRKLDGLRFYVDAWGDKEELPEFVERGFDTFVVELARENYAVMKIVRQISKTVFEALPSPVYVVSAHGPLENLSGKNTGYAATSVFVGSYETRNEAKAAAIEAMEKMTAGVKGVNVQESWTELRGGGMIVAMVPGRTWEVRIRYEDEVHKRAMEDVERKEKEEKESGKGKGREREMGWRY